MDKIVLIHVIRHIIQQLDKINNAKMSVKIIIMEIHNHITVLKAVNNLKDHILMDNYVHITVQKINSY